MDNTAISLIKSEDIYRKANSSNVWQKIPQVGISVTFTSFNFFYKRCLGAFILWEIATRHLSFFMRQGLSELVPPRTRAFRKVLLPRDSLIFKANTYCCLTHVFVSFQHVSQHIPKYFQNYSSIGKINCSFHFHSLFISSRH